MTKTLTSLTLFMCAAISFYSCKSAKESVALRKADIEQSKENKPECFVEMSDGTIKNYQSLKLVRGFFTTPCLLANGKIKIRATEIKAYQNKDHYAISQRCFASGHKTYVSTETLPGFAIRVAKGKINVFAKKFYNGVAAVDEYYVQLGNDGKILAYTTETMNLMVQADPDALDFFIAKKYRTPRSKIDPVRKQSIESTSKLITKNR